MVDDWWTQLSENIYTIIRVYTYTHERQCVAAFLTRAYRPGSMCLQMEYYRAFIEVSTQNLVEGRPGNYITRLYPVATYSHLRLTGLRTAYSSIIL